MLEIHIIKDDETVKHLATEANIEYNNNDIYLGVYIDDKIAEYLCYRQFDKTYTVIYVSDKTNDFQLIYGLAKTLIFLADMRMMEKVTLPLNYERIAKAIGFDMDDGVYQLKISDYQSKCGKYC